YANENGRLAPLELAATQTPNSALEMPITADVLKTAGFEVQQRYFGAALFQDNQLRASFPGLQFTGIGAGAPALGTLASAQIPTADNRWLGANRGGWSSATYDRLLSSFNVTLEPQERVALLRQMIQVMNEDVPWISLFFKSGSFASVSKLKGPASAAPEANMGWNVHQWEFQ